MTLDRVRQELDVELEQRLDAGLCGCPCGKQLPRLRSAKRRYIDERHKDRADKDRLSRLAKAAGVPVRQTRKTLEAGDTTRDRRGDAPRPVPARQRRRREGVTIYLPTPGLAERLAALLNPGGTRKGRVASELGQRAYLSGGIAAAPAIVREYVEALEAAYAERLDGELEPAREAIAKALERRRRRA